MENYHVMQPKVFFFLGGGVGCKSESCDTCTTSLANKV